MNKYTTFADFLHGTNGDIDHLFALILMTALYQEPMRSAMIDSCIRVVDNGRESQRRKVCHIHYIVPVLDPENICSCVFLFL